MKIKDIELANVSRYRGELMGAAMLFIILFHVPLARSNEFFGLRRCGNVGVDMFLFLSGIGLWFSWVKNQDVWKFYKRRLLRIYRTNLLVYPCHHDAIPMGTTIYEAHPEASYLQMATCDNDIMVHLGAVDCAIASGRRAYRDILESRTYILYRHKLRRTGATRGKDRWCRHMDGTPTVSGYFQFVCLSGTDDSRTIPPICRAHDIYPFHHHANTDDESCVPSHSKMVQSLLRILWSTQSRGISDTQSLCDGIHSALSSGILAHSTTHYRDNHPAGLGVAESTKTCG